jgi:hypothetical protein
VECLASDTILDDNNQLNDIAELRDNLVDLDVDEEGSSPFKVELQDLHVLPKARGCCNGSKK